MAEIRPGVGEESLDPIHLLFPEALALWNPPLSAVAIAWAAREHERASGQAMNFPKALLILPLTLHEPTSESIAHSPRLSFATWVLRNPVLMDSFAVRARVMVEPTQRAMRFGLRAELFEIREGSLSVAKRMPRIADASTDAQVAIRASQIVGKWLAKTDSVTAFSLLGIRA